MDFIHRKVFLTKNLVPHDSDNDGVMDSLVLSATTKNIQVPLRQSFDDIGVYEVADEESFEIIDIGGFMDDGIPGGVIEQPTTGPSVSGNTWNGGGNSGTDPTSSEVIYYCDDQTALNYTPLTTSTVNGQTVYVLNNQTYYSPYPSFIPSPSMCEYESTPINDQSGQSGGGNVSSMFCYSSSSGHGDPGHVSTLVNPRTGYCNHSWFNVSPWDVKDTWAGYIGTALSKAVSYCQARGFTTVLQSSDFVNGTTTLPQGDPNTNPNQPWAGVKLQNHVTGQCNATPGTSDIILTGHYYHFCFYCKK